MSTSQRLDEVSRVSSLRRSLLAVVPAGIALSTVPGLAHAQGAVPKEGVEYKLVNPPQPTEAQGKVEVIEFFWYACPHCAAFQPYMEKWIKAMPPDVVLHRVPVAFTPDREPHSRTYYALEAMGLLEKMHQKMFYALVTERQRLFTADEIADFMAKNGIDRKKWLDTYNSFSVVARAQAARRIVEAYQIDGTPALGVGGRYWTSPSLTRNPDAALETVNYLIAKVRKGGK